jgi:hypothetical protein
MKTHDELMKLTKVQLEQYGRTLGVELDRRKKKDALVGLLIDVQELCKPKKEEESLTDTVEDVIEEIQEQGQGFIAWLKKLFS